MRKIIVLTLLMVFVCVPLFAATDWDEFESGRNNIKLEGYQGQPGYIQFEDGNGTETVLVYWNATAGELYYLTPDERDNDYPVGTVSGEKNVGMPLVTMTSTTRP